MGNNTQGGNDRDDDKLAKDILGRQGNQVTGTDEEQMPSGVRPDLEPEDRSDDGQAGDGGGVGKGY
jgi:hypothetical protein